MMNPLLDALRQAELGLPIDYDERAVHVPEYISPSDVCCSDCGKPVKARGYCSGCYDRAMRMHRAARDEALAMGELFPCHHHRPLDRCKVPECMELARTIITNYGKRRFGKRWREL